MKIDEIKALLLHSPTEEELSMLAQDGRSGVQKLLATYYKRQENILKKQERFAKLLRFEKLYWDAGTSLVAGVDEAGRGPLAGPLVVAAVILPQGIFISGLNDSKQLSAEKRESLYPEILVKAISVSVIIVGPKRIDELNIYAATKEAMERSLWSLQPQPQAALIDAMPLKIGCMEIRSIVHGDALSASIAAASVIAKVTRDRIMLDLDKEFPQYGFAQHKGYGSKMHMEAIAQYGATKWHRRSYEPVKSMNLSTVGEEVYTVEQLKTSKN